MSDTNESGAARQQAIRRIVADLARIAHYSLDGVTKNETARDLAYDVRRLNGCVDTPWTDTELTQLLGRAAPSATLRPGGTHGGTHGR